jgi:anti-anti-sigma factor
MNITTQEQGDIKVLRFEGRLDTNTSPDAQTALEGLIGEGAQKILVDFEKLDYVSSAGLRVLLSTAKQLTRSSGELRLSNLNETVQEIFDISGFDTLLNVFGSREEALSGF